MEGSVRSYIHTAIQFAAIFYFIISFNWTANIFFQALICISLLLGVWSVWAMRHSVLTVLPDPQENTHLITSGPYKLVRHPMYASLFILLSTILFFSFNYEALIVYLVFATNQLLKLLYEEALMSKKVAEYNAYMQKTWRLVPWIF